MSRLVRGDVVFVRGTGFISRAIEDITHSAYSHVALAVSSDHLIESQGGRVVGYQSASAYAGAADVYRTSLAPQILNSIVTRAESHLGEQYDYFLDALELIRYETGVQLPYHEHHDLICSMLIADAFRPTYDPCPGIPYPAPADEAKSSLWRYQFSF